MNELDSIEIYIIVFTFIEKILVTQGDVTMQGLTERILRAVSEAEGSIERKIKICRKELAILVISDFGITGRHVLPNGKMHVPLGDRGKYASLKPILETYRSSKLRKAKFTITEDYEEIFKVFEAVKTYIRKTEGPSSFAITNLIENKLN